MKKIFLLILVSSTLCGCQRSCQKIDRSFQMTDRDYTIVLYSGGDTVFVDHFNGIVNNSEASDGIYYTKDGTLIEVSGDYVITSK